MVQQSNIAYRYRYRGCPSLRRTLPLRVVACGFSLSIYFLSIYLVCPLSLLSGLKRDAVAFRPDVVFPSNQVFEGGHNKTGSNPSQVPSPSPRFIQHTASIRIRHSYKGSIPRRALAGRRSQIGRCLAAGHARRKLWISKWRMLTKLALLFFRFSTSVRLFLFALMPTRPRAISISTYLLHFSSIHSITSSAPSPRPLRCAAHTSWG